MPQTTDWERFIGRRLKLRDLHVFAVVAQSGSMAKAAAQLGVTQPTVSEIIADLEKAVGVRLLDRGPHGVEPTIYGQVLLKGGKVAFDEIKQSIQNIQFLADPTMGELRVGCPESLAAAILPPIVQRLAAEHPGVTLHLDATVNPTPDMKALRERAVDLVLARINPPVIEDTRDLNIEVLFDDELVVVAGAESQWAGRNKVDPAELVNAPWVMTPTGLATQLIGDAFKSEGLDVPNVQLVTFSLLLRAQLVATNEFITVLPRSVLALSAAHFPMEVLPVDLSVQPWPVAIISLKERSLTPVAELFIDRLRAYAKSITAEDSPKSKSA